MNAKISENMPSILTGIGIAGFITSTVLAVRSTPKAVEMLKKAKTNKEKAKILAVQYGPSVIAAIGAGAAVVEANHMHLQREAAFGTALTISECYAKRCRDKIIEEYGRDTLDEIEEKVAKDVASSHELDGEANYNIDDKRVWFIDPFNNEWLADANEVDAVINKLNYRLQTEHWISVNDFYYELRQPPMEVGNDLGWHIHNGLIERRPYRAALDKHGIPCKVLSFRVDPRFKNY